MRTAGGERTFKASKPSIAMGYRRAAFVWGLMRLTKLSGVQSRPTMKEREKFNVASVERNRPRRRREKDLVRKYC
jgi:hypothetical protein